MVKRGVDSNGDPAPVKEITNKRLYQKEKEERFAKLKGWKVERLKLQEDERLEEEQMKREEEKKQKQKETTRQVVNVCSLHVHV